MDAARRSLLFDAALALLAFAAAAAWWTACVAAADVSGDAFLPIECGWRSLHTLRPVQPGQPIYGYGLCVSGAALLAFASDMADVARNRALAGALAAPLTYVAVRALAAGVVSARAATADPARLAAPRIGALAAAALVARHPSLIASNLEGTHGYLAGTWIALAVAMLAVATTRRAPVAAVVGFAAVPMAVMNHPFAAWLAVTALVLVPAVDRASGRRAVVAGIGAGALLSLPRVRPLLVGLGSEGDLGRVAAPDVGTAEAATGLVAGLASPAHALAAAGLLALLALLLPRRRSRDAPASAAPTLRGRAPAPGHAPPHGSHLLGRAWGLAALGSVAALAGLVGLLGFVRPYHVQLLTPLGGLGLGLAVARLAAAAVRVHPVDPTIAAAEPPPPPDAGLARTARAAAALATAAVVAPALVVLVASGGRGLLPGADCPAAPPSAATAAGNAHIQAAVAADAAARPSSEGVVVSDLHLGTSSPDHAVAVALGLWGDDVEPERLACCAANQPATWYWIVSGDGDAAERLAAAPGVRRLTGPPGVAETVLAASSPGARHGLRDALCDRAGPAHERWTSSYRTWLQRMDHAVGTRTLVPPDPLACPDASDDAPPVDPADHVTGLRRTLAEAPFRWLRGPDDVPASLAGRTVVLQVFDCLDPQISAARTWLDRIEDREIARGGAVVSILLSPQPEYRDPEGDLLCGFPHGRRRTLGLALDGSLKLDLDLRATPRTFVFDGQGRLRGRWAEPILSGTELELDADALLDRLYAESQARQPE